MAKWRKWSPEKVDRLLDLYRANIPLKDIATALDTTKGAVGERVSILRDRLGVEAVPYRVNREWSGKDIRTVETMISQGRSCDEVAAAVGRTVWAVRVIMTKYGIRSPGWRGWSDDERRTLRQLVARGKTSEECAAHIGRTVKAIEFQRVQMRKKAGA